MRRRPFREILLKYSVSVLLFLAGSHGNAGAPKQSAPRPRFGASSAAAKVCCSRLERFFLLMTSLFVRQVQVNHPERKAQGLVTLWLGSVELPTRMDGAVRHR